MALTKTFAAGQILTANDVITHLTHQVPAAGDPYDTGWVNILAEAGFTSAARIRRIGNVLYLKGTINASLPAGVTTTVARVPAAFRGLTDMSIIISTATTTGRHIDYATLNPTSGYISFRHTTAIGPVNISVAGLSGIAL